MTVGAIVSLAFIGTVGFAIRQNALASEHQEAVSCAETTFDALRSGAEGVGTYTCAGSPATLKVTASTAGGPNGTTQLQATVQDSRGVTVYSAETLTVPKFGSP